MLSPFKYLYGPIFSWRLGRSLGIDPLSNPYKLCNMNCVYCQLGLTAQVVHTRQEYVPTQAILDEVSQLPLNYVDYLTFSGRGEPTLAINLGEAIRAIKKLRHERVAVITNSSLMNFQDVQDDLAEADFVLAKLDAADRETFKAMGGADLEFHKVVQGIRAFRHLYKGKLALQIMLIDQNLEHIADIAALARDIAPDEIQLNTPLRPCPVKPIDKFRMEQVRKLFGDLPVVTVWDAPHKEYTPLDDDATVKRHGNYFKTRYGV